MIPEKKMITTTTKRNSVKNICLMDRFTIIGENESRWDHTIFVLVVYNGVLGVCNKTNISCQFMFNIEITHPW